jgi:ATP-dependent Zn protease
MHPQLLQERHGGCAVLHSSEMHEATRRLLGVLLRQLDGFGPRGRSIVIGATNRRQDLDPALLSRFDAHVSFGLPSPDSRRARSYSHAESTLPLMRCIFLSHALCRLPQSIVLPPSATSLLPCTC